MSKVVFKKLKKIISIELSIPNENIDIDFCFNNIDLIKKNELFSQIEEYYKIKFPDNINLTTLKDILDYLEIVL